MTKEESFSQGLKYEIKNGAAWVVGIGSCEDENLLIPMVTEDGYKVVGIEEEAFAEQENIISVIIPKSIEIIKGCAFGRCYNLKSVKLHYGLKEIRGYAFADCTSLTSIEIPSSVINIGNNPDLQELSKEEILLRQIFGEKSAGGVSSGNPFKGCSKLRSIRVNSSNPVYHDHINSLIDTQKKTLVSGCKNSHIPDDDSVEIIGDHAFSGCTRLNYIYRFEDSKIKTIGYKAFENCSSMQFVHFPETLTHIDSEAFRGCQSLSEISLPDSLTSIGGGAFSKCDKLYKLEIPSQLAKIGYGAFSDCRNLNIVSYNENSKVTEIADETFSGCVSLMSVHLPKSLQKIGESAFEQCRNLQHIDFPNSLEHIEKNAFKSCENLEDIFIPESVTSIEKDAFLDCWPSLDTIKCSTNIKPENWDPEWNRKGSSTYYKIIWGYKES